MSPSSRRSGCTGFTLARCELHVEIYVVYATVALRSLSSPRTTRLHNEYTPCAIHEYHATGLLQSFVCEASQESWPLSPALAMCLGHQPALDGPLPHRDGIRSVEVQRPPHCLIPFRILSLTVICIDDPLLKDKSYRKFQSTMDKVLATFDGNLQEWADYISFLSRLLKVCESFRNRI